jgi:hypothetical protein
MVSLNEKNNTQRLKNGLLNRKKKKFLASKNWFMFYNKFNPFVDFLIENNHNFNNSFSKKYHL